MKSRFILSPAAAGLAACGPSAALVDHEVHGLEASSPVQELALHVSGFHYVADDLATQMETDHYCQRKSDELTWCALYDPGSTVPALIGVEYIVPRAVFDALPEAEKLLWHPHTYEVKSGALAAPELPPETEHALMVELIGTYGKTWHLWDPALNAQPIDTPRLMKAFTEDGQLDPALLQARDERLGIDSAALRLARADIVDPGFDPVVLEELQVCEPLPTGDGGPPQ